MGVLVLANPQSPLASFAYTIIDSTINVYAMAVRNRNSPRMVKNLNWLVGLRDKIMSRAAQMPAVLPSGDPDFSASQTEDVDTVDLLGWRTRLIERAGQGLLVSRTIHAWPKSDEACQSDGDGIDPGVQLPHESLDSDQHLGSGMPNVDASIATGQSLVSEASIVPMSVGSGVAEPSL
jgi:hypothetical protein